MTAKHFILIANAVHDSALSYTDRVTVAHSLADAFENVNPRFDRDRFVEACRHGA